MSPNTPKNRSKTVATQAAALCVGVGVCWFVANFVISPTRPLSAGANDQPTRPVSIKLGLPTFNIAETNSSTGSANSADSAVGAATTWKTPDEELQLVRIDQGAEGGGTPITIQPHLGTGSRQNATFRNVSQSGAGVAEANAAAEAQRRRTAELQEWSVPGSNNRWQVAQSETSSSYTASSSASNSSLAQQPQQLPTGSLPEVGVPQPITDAVRQPEVTNEVQLIPALPAMPVPEPPASSVSAQPSVPQQTQAQPPQAAEATPVQATTPPAIASPPIYVAPDGGYKNFPAEESPLTPAIAVPGQPTETTPILAVPMPDDTPPIVRPAEDVRPPQAPQMLIQPQMNQPYVVQPQVVQPQIVQPQVVQPERVLTPQQTQSTYPESIQQPVPQYSQPVPQLPLQPQFSQPSQQVPPMPLSQPGIYQGMPAPNYGMGVPHNMGTPSGPPIYQPETHLFYSHDIPVQGQFAPAPNSNVYSETEPGHAVQPMQLFGHSMSGSFPGTSGFRATVESDADYWMAPYASRALNSVATDASPVIPNIPDIPAGFTPWWDKVVQRSLGVHASSHSVNVSSLLQDALEHSPQVVAIKTEPEIQYRVVTQEAAKFDWTAFLEATYDDLNDPVGSDLATGNGEDRLLTRKALSSGGIRRRNLEGGELRIAQDLGFENQNSRFFVPNNQGSTRLELSYRQPLMDGAGRAYNESEIVLARIQANSSEDEVVDALQDHLAKVTEAYWTLYRARAEFFQRQKLLASAREVLLRLEGRSRVDTIPRQILRARAAVARSQTRIQRTVARVRDAEAQLRLLVNSPEMLNGGHVELMPTEPPRLVTETQDLQSVLQTALINRPDISEAIRKMRAAGVRLGVSKNELLPRLDFLVETYVADLAGDYNTQQALRGQFLDNRPGYTIGLEFEVPIGNRAAIAKLEQREWELKRSVNIFRATVEKSLTDVEIANREVQTAYSEILSRYQSMKASDNESRYLQDRFEVLPAAEDSATLLLEDLLDSFERLADEESAFVQAQVDHAIAAIKLKKELGTLLRSRNSRPELEVQQAAWMSERIIDAGPNMQQDFGVHYEGDQPAATGMAGSASTASTLPSAGHQLPSRNSIPSTTGQMPQQAGETMLQHGSAGVPIPLTPTTWQRPQASSYGGN